METRARSARRILETVYDLFYEEGIRAVGVDAIAERSGVGKMTLYRHFPSKDDLVAAYLRERARAFWGWFEGVVGRHPGSPREQLRAVFVALPDLLERADYRGCPFLNASTEFPDHKHPARRAALDHKRKTRGRLRALAEEAGADDPDWLADRLMLFLDGAFASTQVFGAGGPASRVSSAAASFIDEQLPPTGGFASP